MLISNILSTTDFKMELLLWQADVQWTQGAPV